MVERKEANLPKKLKKNWQNMCGARIFQEKRWLEKKLSFFIE